MCQCHRRSWQCSKGNGKQQSSLRCLPLPLAIPLQPTLVADVPCYYGQACTKKLFRTAFWIQSQQDGFSMLFLGVWVSYEFSGFFFGGLVRGIQTAKGFVGILDGFNFQQL